MDISTVEAKNRLPQLIRAVEAGEEVIITRHGKPVAQMGPPPAARDTPLHIRPDHMEHVYGLPPIHKVPFDYVLIAQATAESLTLVTTDSQIPLYASPSFQVVI